MISNLPIVTIYITNFNYSKYITKAIESALNQTYENIEILIIDDGSTDNSVEIINNYSTNPKITPLFKKNEGLLAACNTALYSAKGEYILRLDADDWLDENIISVFVNKMQKDKQIEILFPDYYEVDQDGNILNTFRRHNFDEVNLHDQSAHGACTMFKTKTLIDMGGYDEYFECQDGVDIWLRFIKKFKVSNINIPLFYYRKHESSLTRKEQKILKNRTKILEKNSNETDGTTVAIIPIRGKKYDIHSNAFHKINDKPLLQWKIDSLLKSKKIEKIIITSPDEEVLEYIDKQKNPKLLAYFRDAKLANPSVLLDQSIQAALDLYKKEFNSEPEFSLLAKISSPFINYKHYDNAINSMKIFNTDMIVAVSHENSTVYIHNGNTMKPLNKSDYNKIKIDDKRYIKINIESQQLYVETGNFLVLRNNSLEDYANFEKLKVGHEILNGLSKFEINDELTLKLAKFISKNIYNDYSG
jgi:glycosyltransferase involved in cell wall biosynthesis